MSSWREEKKAKQNKRNTNNETKDKAKQYLIENAPKRTKHGARQSFGKLNKNWNSVNYEIEINNTKSTALNE